MRIIRRRLGKMPGDKSIHLTEPPGSENQQRNQHPDYDRSRQSHQPDWKRRRVLTTFAERQRRQDGHDAPRGLEIAIAPAVPLAERNDEIDEERQQSRAI